MPKLRAVRTKEEAANVPAEEPVEVVLVDETQLQQEPEKDAKEKVEVKDSEDRRARRVVQEQKETEEEEVKDQPDISALQRELEALKRAEQTAQEQLLAERQRSQDNHRLAQEAREQSRKHQGETVQAQYDAIVNAMEAARSDADSAQRDIEVADAAGDLKLKGEAYRRLARAEANQARLEDGKLSIEARRQSEEDEPKKQKTEETQPPQQPQLPAAAQTWLKEHPEYLSDPSKNRQIQAAHNFVAEVERTPLWTPEYFEKIETHLGLRKAAPKTDDEDDDSPPVRRKVVTQAPPTRESVSLTTGKPQSTKVTLTPKQREAAKIAGIDEITYARGVQELERRKKEGMYQEQ